jgi:hypothetical protein
MYVLDNQVEFMMQDNFDGLVFIKIYTNDGFKKILQFCMQSSSTTLINWRFSISKPSIFIKEFQAIKRSNAS